MKTDKQIKKYVFQAFVGLVLLVNSGLTFVFGGTYGSETFPTSLPNLSFMLGGVMLVVFYDVAAGAWFQARGREGQSNQQRAIASILAVCAMLASVSVSAIQLLMTTTLVDLSSWRNGVGVLGLIILVLMASAHFIGLFAYRYTDPMYIDQDADAELMAEMQTLRLEQKRRVMQLTVARAEQMMLDRVEWLAESEAETAVRQLLADIRTSPVMPSHDPKIIEGTARPADTRVEPKNQPTVIEGEHIANTKVESKPPRKPSKHRMHDIQEFPVHRPRVVQPQKDSIEGNKETPKVVPQNGSSGKDTNFPQNGHGGNMKK